MVDKVCGEDLDGPVFDHLATLVDNSLVNSVTGEAGGTRFKQLALLREYGLELLRDSGEYESTMERLIDYYVERSETMRRRLQFDNAADGEVSADHANLLAAMDWSLESGSPGRMGRALMAMWVYWFRGDRVRDAEDLGRARLRRDLQCLSGLPSRPAISPGWGIHRGITTQT